MRLLGRALMHIRSRDFVRASRRHLAFRFQSALWNTSRRDWRGFPIRRKAVVLLRWTLNPAAMWRKSPELVLRALEVDKCTACSDRSMLELVFGIMADHCFGRPLLTFRDMCNVYLWAKRARQVPGDFAEVGVYRGGSARVIASVKGDRHLYLFDTFEGLPAGDPDVDVLSVGEMKDTSLEEVQAELRQFSNIRFYPGTFPQTAGSVAERRFAFVHLDVDLYTPTLDAVSFFYPRMTKGGVILMHDYGSTDTPGVRKSIDEFFDGKPERPVEIWDSHCVVVKQ